MNTNWRKPMPRLEETMLANAVVAQTVAAPVAQDPRQIAPRNSQWTVRVLRSNFLHAGKPAVVGDVLKLDADIAQSLIARSLAELVAKDPPRARGPQW